MTTTALVSAGSYGRAGDAASKSQRAYDWILERISRSEFGAGHRLVLGPIADTLGMSVVPVREAIRRLEAEGLVTYERNVGARVAMVDETEYLHTMQTLGLVEGAAISLSAPALTAEHLDHAAAINGRMTDALEHFDPHAFTQLNRQFHAVLYEPCPNPHILGLVHRGWSRLAGLRDSIFEFVPGRAQHSVAEHAEILALLRDGAEPLEIELAVRAHRQRTVAAYLRRRDVAGAQTFVDH